MITAKDMYNVLSAVVPLYVAMFLAYGSVKWWKIFTPDQCSGINRFVTIFAIPLLSFHFISTNNIYTMNYKFVAADSLQKAIILMVLGIWTQFGKTASLEWMISLFALSTLPNTLVMGIPLLEGMYGDFSGSLMVQVVVLQSVIWYTLMLALFEYRGAKVFIMEQFPDRTAAEIVSVRVDWDIVSLDGREPLETDTEVGDDGKVHVTVRRSTSSRSHGLESIPSLTPRLSNLTDAEIYSLPSPGGSTFNHTDFYSNFKSADMYSINSSREPTPRTSNIDEEVSNDIKGSFDQTSISGGTESYITPNRGILSPNDSKTATKDGINMSLRSSNTYAVSDVNQYGVPADNKNTVKNDPKSYTPQHYLNEGKGLAREPRGPQQKAMKVNVEMASPNRCWVDSNEQNQIGKGNPKKNMPGANVMTRLILMMVWRKLIRNPNTYSSVLGLIWSLVAYKWNIEMPKLVYESISILSDAGLGMAMFSLGLFMALQPRIIACGKSVAAFAMTVRFVTGPAVMAAASIAVGLRGPLLQVAIVQAALPQGIVPFVFAKEYNVHPEILSTAVIFGMLIAMPITLLYYALLGL